MENKTVKENVVTWKQVGIVVMVILVVLAMVMMRREVKATEAYEQFYDSALNMKADYLTWSEAYALEFRELVYLTNDFKLIDEINELEKKMMQDISNRNVFNLLLLQEDSKVIIDRIYSKFPGSRPVWIKENLEIMQTRMDESMLMYGVYQRNAQAAEDKKIIDVNLYYDFHNSWIGQNVIQPVIFKIDEVLSLHAEFINTVWPYPEYRYLSYYHVGK